MSRRGDHRRLNQMNGDYLAQLKKPLRSEMNRHVIGTNKAVATLMNKRLDLYFKDKNIALEKIRRRQEAVYGTMLRVLKEKKILQRITYKRRQEESRQMFHKTVNNKIRADVLRLEEDETKTAESSEKPNDNANVNAKDNANDNDIPKSDENGQSSGSADTKNDRLLEPSLRPPIKLPVRTYERKAKVLEVSKKSPLAPITRERSDIRKDPITDHNKGDEDLSKFTNIRKGPLPGIKSATMDVDLTQEERSQTDLIITLVSKAQDVNDGITSKEEASYSPSRSLELSPSRPGKSTVMMPPISEINLKENSPPTLGGNNSDATRNTNFAYNNDDNEKDIQMAAEETAQNSNKNEMSSDDYCSAKPNPGTKKQLTLAERNRRRAMAKQRRLHEELQNEPLTVYVKDAKGNYVSSDTEFKRKQFHPPSLKEKYFQQKMLRAQMEARLEQRRKLEEFFERMAAEERERHRIREAFKRQALEEAEEMRRKLEEESEKLGFSPSQLVTLFSQGILPKGIDPSSFEAIRYCKYIRIYPLNYNDVPTSDVTDDEKATSWSSTKFPL